MMTTHAYIKPYSGTVLRTIYTNVQMRAAGPGRPEAERRQMAGHVLLIC